MAGLSAVASGNEADFANRFIIPLESYATASSSQLAILTMIALATLVSEDLACIAAGLLAAKSVISISGAVTASALGIYIGDILLYLTGYLVGITALDHPPLKWIIKPQTVEQCKALFEQRGAQLIITSRFLPGTRTATFFAAGLVKMSLTKLMVIFAVAVLLWSPILVLSAMIIGREVIQYVELYSDH